ncbi:MAG: Fic family protein [Chlamydiia bacterium]
MDWQKKLRDVSAKKAALDALRPLPPAVLINLQEWFRIETTYTSNALEGNTLTSSETAIVVEKGLTIGGKTVREHLEAINHAHAFDYIVTMAAKDPQHVSLREIRSLHQLVLKGIDDAHAGGWREVHVQVSGSVYEFPPPWKVAELMDEFESWLKSSKEHPVVVAAEAHLRLVTIHPFVDGNGRTARLLMNLLLLQAGYPPAMIYPNIRARYIDSLVQAQQFEDADRFMELIIEAVDGSLDIYLRNGRKQP